MTEQEEIDLNTEYKKLIEEVQPYRAKIKDVFDKIGKYSKEFDEALATMKNNLDQVLGEAKASEESKKKIDELYSMSEETENNISALLKTLKIKEVELDTIYNKLANFKNNIPEIAQDIETKKGETEALLAAITTIKGNADEKIKEIINILEDAQSKIGEITVYYNKFTELAASLENEDTGLHATIEWLATKRQEVEKIYNTIDELRTSADKTIGVIEEKKKQSEDLISAIEEILKQSEKDRNEINTYLGAITNSSLANAFDIRKQELLKSAKSWKLVFIISIAVLLGLLIGIFAKSIFGEDKIPDLTGILYRITFSSPILFLIAFSGREYSLSRTNEEKYAFKSTISLAYPTHLNYLMQKFGHIDEGHTTTIRILENIYATIYKAPYLEEELSDFEAKLLKHHKDQIFTKNTNKKHDKDMMTQLFDSIKNITPENKEAVLELIKHILPSK